MNLQDLLFSISVACFVVFAVLLVCAIVYFVRADIRSVYADLSGKARQADIMQMGKQSGGRSRGGSLAKNEDWHGSVSPGKLRNGMSGESGSSVAVSTNSVAKPASDAEAADLIRTASAVHSSHTQSFGSYARSGKGNSESFGSDNLDLADKESCRAIDAEDDIATLVSADQRSKSDESWCTDRDDGEATIVLGSRDCEQVGSEHPVLLIDNVVSMNSKVVVGPDLRLHAARD